MGAKGRKRKQRRKAANRTGLLKNISGYFSTTQRNKRARALREHKELSDALKRYFNS